MDVCVNDESCHDIIHVAFSLLRLSARVRNQLRTKTDYESSNNNHDGDVI